MNHSLPLLGTGWKRRLAQIGIGIIAALLVFEAGIFVGFHKARLSYGSGARFYRQVMIGDKDDSGAIGLPVDDFSASHGVAGKIISVSLPYIVVTSPDNIEKTAVVGSSTVIRLFKGAATAQDIRAGDFVVILGDPDDAGRIDARFVRIAPPQAVSQMAGTSSTSVITPAP